jgi:hypothetical protein
MGAVRYPDTFPEFSAATAQKTRSNVLGCLRLGQAL